MSHTNRVRRATAFLASASLGVLLARSASSQPASPVWVSDLAATSQASGWGPVEKDMSNGERAAGDGHPLTIAGVVFAKGLGAHAPSDVRYDLAGQYTTFESEVGVDDEVGKNGSIVFQVWADGARLYESPVLRGGMPARHVSVDVTARRELRLVVTDAGDGIVCDHADWAGARLLGGAVPPSLDPADVPLVPGTPSLGATRGAERPEGATLPALYGSLTVRASRNETIDVAIRADTRTADTISFAWKGNAPTGVTVELSDLPVVWTSRPSEPSLPTGAHLDPVVPKTDASVAPSSALGTWLLGEITTTAATAPGLYTGEWRLQGAGVALTVNLRVWPMTMKTDDEALPSYWIQDEWANVLQHWGGAAPDLNTRLALQQDYARLERAHRMTIIASTVVGGELPIVSIGGQPQLDVSFTRYDEIVMNNRPSNAMISIPWNRDTDPATRTAYLEAIENTIAARGWQDRAFIYLTDEPAASKYPTIVQWSKAIKAVAPHVKIMVTTVADPALVPYVDIFVVLVDQVDSPGLPAPSVYDQITTQGKQLWLYVSCDSHGCGGSSQTPWPDLMLDDPSSHIRSLGWMAHRYRAQGFLYYYTNAYYYTGDPWNGEWLFGGNGDGTVVYPGRPGEHGFTRHQGVASLRMKLWRETAFDAEYLRMLDAKGVPASLAARIDATVSSSRSWSEKFQDYQALRDEIGRYLATH